jgi:NADPH:quinone reductase-like Zn-dependent oxidoreductase
MRAVVITKHGDLSVLQVQHRPDPPPAGSGQVTIAVRAAGVNFADHLARVGLYPDAPKPPAVVGYEVAGTIEAIGDGVPAERVGSSPAPDSAATPRPSTCRPPTRCFFPTH